MLNGVGPTRRGTEGVCRVTLCEYIGEKLIDGAGIEPINTNWTGIDLGWKLEDDLQPEERNFQQN